MIGSRLIAGLHTGVGIIKIKEKWCRVWGYVPRYHNPCQPLHFRSHNKKNENRKKGTKEKEGEIEKGSSSRWQYCPATRPTEPT